MIEETDIVEFENTGNSLASRFCYDKQLTGKVIEINHDICKIDFGLYYNVYSHTKDLRLVTRQLSAPTPDPDEI